MATDPQKSLTFHFDTLPKATKKALDFLSQQSWLEKSDWYLAGGTALTLQSGNRKSVDLDFFTQKKSFDTKTIFSKFLNNKNWETTVEDANTIYGELFNAKVSFIAYPYFVPKQPLLQYGSIKILSATDIAVMKIIAISQRGRKRDFFDLYWCAQNFEPLEITIKRLKKQYPTVAHDYHHILKSMVYFDDAETDPEPEIYFKAGWSNVKSFFKKEIPKITKDVMFLV
ncbi:MAG: nucleotidyl transferase AbiEii/AbiGii toxin family protein [Patescibacteria group bacterium]